jgi:UDP-N-acetylmuramoyl-L-alanyl-D-glutamate--2,6-diaminopimelate ligase
MTAAAPALHTLPSPAAAAAWLRTRLGPAEAAATLRTDHRALQPGDAFIAWPGATHDARRFVPQALAAGAVACLVEAQGADELPLPADERVAALHGLKAAAGVIADALFGHPGRALDVVAITGTNGKTSSAWWTAQALSACGRRAAVLGTLGAGEPPALDGAEVAAVPLKDTGLTTPDAVALHAALQRFVRAGLGACALEASSIGLAELRLAGLKVDVALFTNFTRDHLDYHGNMADYWAAKRTLFQWPGLRAAVLNVDDARGAELANELQAQSSAQSSAAPPQPALWTFSLQRPARLRAQGLRYGAAGLAFEVLEADTGTAPVTMQTQLVGDYNASNLLGVVGVLRALGLPLAQACAAAARVQPVPGRLQPVHGEGDALQVLVDYAHTPDALDQVLRALRPLAAARGGRLWCVFGCGGNRDATKRPMMGAIAARGADQVVLTSDNPRLEPPAQILAQVLAGITGHDEVAVIEDRREAVAYAIRHAADQDVLLLAGKGHEDYQDLGGVKRPYSDIDQARAALAQRRAGVQP